MSRVHVSQVTRGTTHLHALGLRGEVVLVPRAPRVLELGALPVGGVVEPADQTNDVSLHFN